MLSLIVKNFNLIWKEKKHQKYYCERSMKKKWNWLTFDDGNNFQRSYFLIQPKATFIGSSILGSFEYHRKNGSETRSEGSKVVVCVRLCRRKCCKSGLKRIQCDLFWEKKSGFALRGHLPWNFRFLCFSISKKIQDPWNATSAIRAQNRRRGKTACFHAVQYEKKHNAFFNISNIVLFI